MPLVVYGTPVAGPDQVAHTHNVHLTRSLILDGASATTSSNESFTS